MKKLISDDMNLPIMQQINVRMAILILVKLDVAIFKKANSKRPSNKEDRTELIKNLKNCPKENFKIIE